VDTLITLYGFIMIWIPVLYLIGCIAFTCSYLSRKYKGWPVKGFVAEIAASFTNQPVLVRYIRVTLLLLSLTFYIAYFKVLT
jgi:phage shock protein PspC (stress-responsive transcriptional regulator)